MQTWRSILQAQQELNQLKKTTTITIGNFDGVHLGHKKIMQRVVALARETESVAVALTFGVHTDGLTGEQPLLLNTPTIRSELLARENIDYLLEVAFDCNFASLEPEVFFNTWLLKYLHVKAVVIGYDFRFGAARRGDFTLLQRLGMENQVRVEQISPVCEGQTIISSSRIRSLLMEGQMELANRMLGYTFTIEGLVATGEQRGRKLGFPTANVYLDPQYLLPRYGVYLARMKVGEESFFGLANVGIKPTFGKFLPRVEVYLFDVERDLYNRMVRVEFLQFIRPENRFSGPEALKKQINLDIQMARNFIDWA